MIRQLLLVLFACAAGVHLARAEPGTAGAARLPAESQQHASSASSSNLLAGNANSVAWFVQLSDLHINKWVHHEILPDLQEFGQRVLTGVRPGALLITGDLVDAKTRPEGSQQHEEEWQAYERAWRQLAQSAQLPASAILDLRGNHDVFDTLRNSPQDWFATHSAAAAAHGRQAAATQRLWLSTLPGQLQPQQQHSRKQRRGSGSEGQRRQLLQQQGTGVGNSSNSSSSANSAQKLHSAGRAVMAAADAAAAACPAALLLGIDLAPNIGLHSPTNFFGVAGPALLQQLQQRLQQLRSSSSSSGIADVALPAGCSTFIPIISYSHYPFSTVAAAYGSSSGVADGGGPPAVQGGRALRDLLCRHDVSAHLSGHLHDLLGPRMQVLYDKAALLGGVFGRSRLRAPLHWQGAGATTAAGGGGAFLADLESADWKQRRRWRLMAVDSGSVSFADLHFRRSPCSAAAATAGACVSSSSSDGSSSSSSSAAYSYEVSAVDGSRVVAQHVVMLTWPPDGRYSPLSAAEKQHQQQQQQQQQQDVNEAAGGSSSMLRVRALVLPLQLLGEGSAKQLGSVTLQWFCVGSEADLAAGLRLPSRGKTLGSAQMKPVGQPGGSTRDEQQQQQKSKAAAAAAGSQDSGGEDEHMYAVEQPQVFAAAVPLDQQELQRSCGSSSSSSAAAVVLLQVVVTDDAGGTSSSELRPVLLPQHVERSAAAGDRSSSSSAAAPRSRHKQLEQAVAAAGDGAFVTGSSSSSSSSNAAGGHLPLPSSTVERLLLSFDGPAFAVRLFFAGWLAQVLGLLLLPRLFGRHILALPAHLNKSSSSSSQGRLLRHQQSMPQQQMGELYKQTFCCQQKEGGWCLNPGGLGFCTHLKTLAAAAAALLFRVLGWCVLAGLRLLLLPLAAMAVLAQRHGGLWWALLAHSGWVLAAPWFCAQMGSSSQGLGLWFRWGLLLPLPSDLSPSWVNGDAGSPFWGADVTNTVSNSVSNVSDGEDLADPSGSWQEYVWMGLPDTHLIASLTMCITLAPMTLWLGLVVWHWHSVAAAAARGSSSSGVAAVAEAAAGLLVVGLQGRQQQLAGAGKWLQQQLRVGSGSSGCEAGSAAANGSCTAAEVELQQQADSSSGSTAAAAAAGETGGSSSSSRSRPSPHRLARSRSIGNPAVRRRESVELTAAAAAGEADEDSVSATSIQQQHQSVAAAAEGSSSSCLLAPGSSRDEQQEPATEAAAEEEEATPLLLLSSASSSGAAAALGSAWLQWVGLNPGLNPAAAADPWQASKQRRWLSPRYLAWCLLYFIVLCARGLGRTLQLSLLSLRLPLPLLLLAVPPMAFWFKVCWRLAAAYGPVALFVSPVVGWLPLLLALALRRVRADVAAGKARRRD